MGNRVLNQDKEAFRVWLRSQPRQAEAQAGDPCLCWSPAWFESQGYSVWGVFPEHLVQRLEPAPCNASQEILLSDPDETGFELSDRLTLAEWACDFASEVDRRYQNYFHPSPVTRNQALSVLSEVSIS